MVMMHTKTGRPTDDRGADRVQPFDGKTASWPAYAGVAARRFRRRDDRTINQTEVQRAEAHQVPETEPHHAREREEHRVDRGRHDERSPPVANQANKTITRTRPKRFFAPAMAWLTSRCGYTPFGRRCLRAVS
jgi:hypothetical protein